MADSSRCQDDAVVKPNLKLLEAAQQWKKKKLGTTDEQQQEQDN
jgi:hypothetical protein